MTDDVVKLPVAFKRPYDPGERKQLETVDYGLDGKCNHAWRSVPRGDSAVRLVDAHYLIRDGETEVECGLCGERLDPMWVLRRLAGEETRWRQTLERYQEEMQRLAERKKTKCDHCGQLTWISYAKPAKAKAKPYFPPRPGSPPDAG